MNPIEADLSLRVFYFPRRKEWVNSTVLMQKKKNRAVSSRCSVELKELSVSTVLSMKE